MATGEKATLRLPAPFEHARLDIYPFFPAVPATSGLSLAEIDRPLPFLLYLHDGLLPFHSGSRIDAPPQVAAWCRARGVPLLALDYALLSSPTGSGSATPPTLEDVWASVEAAWAFINDSAVGRPSQADTEETLNWQISATGHGAEADTGTQPLDDAWREFQPRGIDGRAGMLWGTGAGGFLASLGAARLQPAPIAVVLERPMLDLAVPLHPLPPLPALVVRPPPFAYTGPPPAFAGISDRLWFEDVDANAEEHWRTSNGMDVRRPLPGERDGGQALRLAIDAFEAGRQRADTYAAAFSRGRIPTSFAASSSSSPSSVNSPFPPTLLMTNTDSRAQEEAARFLQAVRQASPEGAVADQLLARAAPAAAAGAESVQRYLHVTIDDGRDAVPLLGGRTQMTVLPQAMFAFLSRNLADALFLRASREGADGSGVVEELRRQAHELLGQAKL